MKINLRDRMIFFLPPRYFASWPTKQGMGRCTCQKVLQMAFDLTHKESGALMDQRREGFRILCRMDQFARFIFARAQHGKCVNGITDLEMERETSDIVSTPCRLAHAVGITHNQAVKVQEILHLTNTDIDYFLPHPFDVDVTGAIHQECYW